MTEKRMASSRGISPSVDRRQTAKVGLAQNLPGAEARCRGQADAQVAAEITPTMPGSAMQGAKPRAIIVPGRTFSVGTGAFAMPVAAWFSWPLLGVVFVSTEIIIAIAVLFTALYGSELYSGRAFRLLRWSANRPEPSAHGTPDKPD
jgi:hypothetical protein